MATKLYAQFSKDLSNVFKIRIMVLALVNSILYHHRRWLLFDIFTHIFMNKLCEHRNNPWSPLHIDTYFVVLLWMTQENNPERFILAAWSEGKIFSCKVVQIHDKVTSICGRRKITERKVCKFVLNLLHKYHSDTQELVFLAAVWCLFYLPILTLVELNILTKSPSRC